MKPRYRFTLGGSKVISEPIGWDKITMVLERDTEMWSLVESIEEPFEFYGNTNIGDGGYQYIKEARNSGVDTQVTFLSEISWDLGDTWETFFEGLLDFTTLLEIETKKRFQCSLLRTGPWSKFINRKSVKVDIVDQFATAEITTLPSQKIRKTYRSEQYPFANSNYIRIRYQTTSTDQYGVIDLPFIIYDELTTRYDLVNGVADVPPPSPLFFIKEAGSYTFDVSIVLSNNDAATAGIFPTSGVNVYIQFGNSAPIAFTKTLHGTSGIDERAQYTYSATNSIITGTQIRVYLQNTNLTGDLSILQQDLFEDTYFQMTGDTIAPDSTASGFYIHDVAQAVVRGTSEDDYFYSEYFGGSLVHVINYAEDGCGMLYKLFKGINVRGQSLTDFPFAISWDELWEGIDNIFCLGAGYEITAVSGDDSTAVKEVVRVEQRSYFFDDSSDSVIIEGYERDNNLEISYDTQFLTTAIDIGYQKWQSEELIGTDDTQTKHSYQTRFKTVGTKDQKNIQVLSSLYAASIGIEQTRRKTFEPKKDWKLDEEIFIVQTDDSGDVLTYDASKVSGLLNADSRYNIRLTPASNFRRWLSWLSIAFQNYPSDVFKFIGGEGNINVIFTDLAASGCELEVGTYIDEKADIQVDSSLYQPILLKFSAPFTWSNWKSVRDNRRKSISFKYKDNDGFQALAKCFIKSLKYNPNKSSAEFECWLKYYLVNVPALSEWYQEENSSGLPLNDAVITDSYIEMMPNEKDIGGVLVSAKFAVDLTGDVGSDFNPLDFRIVITDPGSVIGHFVLLTIIKRNGDAWENQVAISGDTDEIDTLSSSDLFIPDYESSGPGRLSFEVYLEGSPDTVVRIYPPINQIINILN